MHFFPFDTLLWFLIIVCRIYCGSVYSACSFQTSAVSSTAVGISHVKPQVSTEPQN